MRERIRYLRKLEKMTQREFGAKIGIVGGTVSDIEQGKLNVTDRNIGLICEKFGVNEEWLRTGKKPIYKKKENILIDKDSFVLEEYLKEQGATDLEIAIVKSYFQIDKDIRIGAIEQFKNAFESIYRTEEEDNTVELRLVCKGGSSIQKVDKDALRKAAMEDALKNDIDDLDI